MSNDEQGLSTVEMRQRRISSVKMWWGLAWTLLMSAMCAVVATQSAELVELDDESLVLVDDDAESLLDDDDAALEPDLPLSVL